MPFKSYLLQESVVHIASDGEAVVDAVIGEGAAILKLHVFKDQPLAIRYDVLLVLNLSLQLINGVADPQLDFDGLASKLHEKLDLLEMQQMQKGNPKNMQSFRFVFSCCAFFAF